MTVLFSQGILGASNQGFSGTTTATSPSFTPAAGDAILVWGYDDVNLSKTLTFGGTGTYNNLASLSIPSQAVGANASATAGLQTLTVTTNATERVMGLALDYSGSGGVTGSIVARTTPGTGTDAILGTSVVVPSGGMLVAICVDRTGPAGTTIAAGSAASASRGSGRATNTYPYIFEEYTGTGGSIQPTFTDATNGATDNYVVGQWVITASVPPLPPCGGAIFVIP